MGMNRISKELLHFSTSRLDIYIKFNDIRLMHLDPIAYI